MLDAFSSDNADDYVAGFPAHPHRGFETVTYILDGHMLHEDHIGNKGNLKSGGVQWMTAGRGIIHSEMPQQERGRMRGFQLWINLPAKDKMKPAGYRDLQASDIPEVALKDGGKVRVIAGSYGGTAGPIASSATDATYLDVHLPAGASFRHPVKDGYNAFAYVYEGALDGIESHAAAVFSTEGEVQVTTKSGARFLLLAARPIGEPIVQYGPFVMNTRGEIEQAIRDYQNGTLAEAPVH
jgi:redox-sensitive bicupin YhaK (pirin superfamily)